MTERIIGVSYEVYNKLGHGFLESVHEEAMALALVLRVADRHQRIGDFFADLVVEHSVILELKAASGIDPSYEAQLLHYLRSTEIEVGLLPNFGPRPNFKRLVFESSMVFENSRKQRKFAADYPDQRGLKHRGSPGNRKEIREYLRKSAASAW